MNEFASDAGLISDLECDVHFWKSKAEKSADRIAELEAELGAVHEILSNEIERATDDELARLRARLEFKQKNIDALVARWEPYIEQLQSELKAAQATIERVRSWRNQNEQ